MPDLTACNEDSNNSALLGELSQANYQVITWFSQPPSEITDLLVESENRLRFSVGRNIHDNSQQKLHHAINLLLNQVEALNESPDEVHRNLPATFQQLISLLNQADHDLSLVRREILPSDPYGGMFTMALESYLVEDYIKLHPDTTFEIEYSLEALRQVYDQNRYQIPNLPSQKMSISLFLREALNNSSKHSKAQKVQVCSKVIVTAEEKDLYPEESWPIREGFNPLSDHYFCLIISDDGSGFDPVKILHQGRHSSFFDFEVRAKLLEGFTTLITGPGKGTTWMLYLPIRQFDS